MDELIFLFSYYRTDAATLKHLGRLQALHPTELIIPLAYNFRGEPLPGTIDVGRDADNFGWPIRDPWREMDKLFYRWFLRHNRPQARRYVWFESDILPQADARSFYGDSWNADIAAKKVLLPERAPKWPFWREADSLGDMYSCRCGVVPLTATLWSDDAMRQVSSQRRLLEIFCELRVGTLARRLGIQIKSITNASQISWHPRNIAVTDLRTWFHPVKTAVGFKPRTPSGVRPADQKRRTMVGKPTRLRTYRFHRATQVRVDRAVGTPAR